MTFSFIIVDSEFADLETVDSTCSPSVIEVILKLITLYCSWIFIFGGREGTDG